MMRIYLQGIDNGLDIKKAVRWGASAIGIRIGYKTGVHPEKARELFSLVPLFVTRVGIFADEKTYELQEMISFCRVNAVHFIGREQTAELKGFSEPLIKSFSMAEMDQAADYPVQAISLPLAEASAAGEFIPPEGKKLILSGTGAQEKMWQRAAERFQPFAAQLEMNGANREIVQWLMQL